MRPGRQAPRWRWPADAQPPRPAGTADGRCRPAGAALGPVAYHLAYVPNATGTGTSAVAPARIAGPDRWLVLDDRGSLPGWQERRRPRQYGFAVAQGGAGGSPRPTPPRARRRYPLGTPTRWHLLPGPVDRPVAQPGVKCPSRTVLQPKVPPLRGDLVLPCDRIDHLLMIAPRPPRHGDRSGATARSKPTGHPSTARPCKVQTLFKDTIQAPPQTCYEARGSASQSCQVMSRPR